MYQNEGENTKLPRESTGGSDLTLHQSLSLKKDKHICHDPFREKEKKLIN
jgi:hypothetical protein